MLTGTPKMLLFAFLVSLIAIGCGSSEEYTEEGWDSEVPVSETARLEYRIDSLMNENRILAQQIDALSSENRSLTARSADLELKLNEALSSMELIETPMPAGTSADIAQGYKGALQEFRSRNYSTAASQFQALLASGISEELVPNCHYWIGESMYGLKRYKDAIPHFEKVFDYQASEKKSYAQFMIGNCYSAMGNKTAAKGAFQTFVSSYPTSPLLRKAQDRLARF